MQLDFSQLTVNQLLDKLGKGGHKPGSGSAAALQGMISSKLVQTVIIISNRMPFILIRQYKQELRHLKLRQNQIFMRLQG